MSEMQAQVLHAIDDMRSESVAKPEPGEGEVLVRIGFCGVCGSDIPRTFTKGTYHFPPSSATNSPAQWPESGQMWQGSR